MLKHKLQVAQKEHSGKEMGAEARDSSALISQLAFMYKKANWVDSRAAELWGDLKEAKWADREVQKGVAKMCKVLWKHYKMPLWYSIMILYNKFGEQRRAILRSKKRKLAKDGNAAEEGATPSKSKKRKATTSLSVASPAPAPRACTAFTTKSDIALGACAIGETPVVYARGTVVSIEPGVAYMGFEEPKNQGKFIVVRMGAPVGSYGNI